MRNHEGRGDLPCHFEVGEGQPVVFLHSMAGSATSWLPQVEALQGDYRCIAWDMPGYGASKPVAPTTAMDEIADLLARFLRHVAGQQRAHLVGLSVGGMILQSFGARHGDLAASLVIMDSSPKFGFESSFEPSQFMDPILAQLASGVAVRDFAEAML